MHMHASTHACTHTHTHQGKGKDNNNILYSSQQEIKAVIWSYTLTHYYVWFSLSSVIQIQIVMFWRRGDKVCGELTLWHVFHHMVTKHAGVTKCAGSASDVTYFVTWQNMLWWQNVPQQCLSLIPLQLPFSLKVVICGCWHWLCPHKMKHWNGW